MIDYVHEGRFKHVNKQILFPIDGKRRDERQVTDVWGEKTPVFSLIYICGVSPRQRVVCRAMRCMTMTLSGFHTPPAALFLRLVLIFAGRFTQNARCAAADHAPRLKRWMSDVILHFGSGEKLFTSETAARKPVFKRRRCCQRFKLRGRGGAGDETSPRESGKTLWLWCELHMQPRFTPLSISKLSAGTVLQSVDKCYRQLCETLAWLTGRWNKRLTGWIFKSLWSISSVSLWAEGDGLPLMWLHCIYLSSYRRYCDAFSGQDGVNKRRHNELQNST